MEHGGYEAFGHHVADHLVAISRAKPLGIAFHPLPERGILVLNLVQPRKCRAIGEHHRIERVFRRDRHLLPGRNCMEGDGILSGSVVGKHAEDVLIFGSLNRGSLNRDYGIPRRGPAGGILRAGTAYRQSYEKHDPVAQAHYFFRWSKSPSGYQKFIGSFAKFFTGPTGPSRQERRRQLTGRFFSLKKGGLSPARIPSARWTKRRFRTERAISPCCHPRYARPCSRRLRWQPLRHCRPIRQS